MSELQGADWTLSRRKRAMDLTAAAALTPVFMALSVGVGASIKAVDGASPVFTQTRYGLMLEPFTFFKFRSMPVNTPETPSRGSTDIRRTHLGQFLSSHHLDEIPQLLHIYKGTMSLVGPRALIGRDMEHTMDILSPNEQRNWVRARSVARPGVVCDFQLEQHKTDYQLGQSDEFVYERALSDIEYVKTASLRKDVSIIMQAATAAVTSLPVRK